LGSYGTSVQRKWKWAHAISIKYIRSTTCSLRSGRGKKTDLCGVQLPTDPKFTSVRSKLIHIPPSYSGPTNQKSLHALMQKELGAEVEAIHEENAKNLNIRMIRLSDDLNFLSTHNPVRCGIIGMGLLVDNETAGLLLSNYHTVMSQKWNRMQSANCDIYTTLRFTTPRDKVLH
jgi:hypothetical protein